MIAVGAIVLVTELLWTIMATIGVLVCSWSLLDSYMDRRDLQRHKLNGDARAMVGMNLRSGRAAMILHVAFLVLDARALGGYSTSGANSIILVGGAFVLVATINVRAVILNQVDRIRLRGTLL